MTAGCTVATAGTVSTAGLVQPVRKLIWAETLPAGSGGTTETVNWYPLPGVLVTSWAENVRLLLSGEARTSGSSVLLVMVTTTEPTSESGGMLMTAMRGEKSIGLYSVPLS